MTDAYQPLDELVQEDPILFMGLDVAVRRDTTAVVALMPDYEKEGHFRLHSHRIFAPPVSLVEEVEPLLFWYLQNCRVARLLYDPYQCMATQQRLQAAGFGDRLQEVNQLTAMVAAANTLHSALTERRLLLYPDEEILSHFSWCRAQHTERGWRIIKQKQSHSIDFVIACAMALLGATQEIGYAMHPAFQTELHSRTAFDIP